MYYPVVPRALRFVLPALAGAAVIATTGLASAQIKSPGAHPKYSVELEPHLVFDWSNHFGNHDEGFGPGIRATIPFLDNGPISKINNNMGIGFGLDWAHDGDACNNWWWRGNQRWGSCTVDVFHLPVVVQWNFFLTDIISVFGEAGLTIERYHWSIDNCNNTPGWDCDGSDTDIDPVFWGGGRFMFGKGSSVSGIVRLGWPYISLGIGIMI